MYRVLLIILLLNYIPAIAQEADSSFFEMMKRKTADSNSTCYYPRVFLKVTQAREPLTWKEAAALYYGKPEISGAERFKKQEGFYKSVREKKYSKAIELGREILNNDPADLRALSTIVKVYEKQGEDDSVKCYDKRLKTLRIAIFQEGNGSTMDKAIKVLDIADGYTIMSMMDRKFISGVPTQGDGGMYETWDTDKGVVYFFIKNNK